MGGGEGEDKTGILSLAGKKEREEKRQKMVFSLPRRLPMTSVETAKVDAGIPVG